MERFCNEDFQSGGMNDLSAEFEQNKRFCHWAALAPLLRVRWEWRQIVNWENGDQFWWNHKPDILARPFGGSHCLQPIVSPFVGPTSAFCFMQRQWFSDFLESVCLRIPRNTVRLSKVLWFWFLSLSRNRPVQSLWCQPLIWNSYFKANGLELSLTTSRVSSLVLATGKFHVWMCGWHFVFITVWCFNLDTSAYLANANDD